MQIVAYAQQAHHNQSVAQNPTTMPGYFLKGSTLHVWLCFLANCVAKVCRKLPMHMNYNLWSKSFRSRIAAAPVCPSPKDPISCRQWEGQLHFPLICFLTVEGNASDLT